MHWVVHFQELRSHAQRAGAGETLHGGIPPLLEDQGVIAKGQPSAQLGKGGLPSNAQVLLQEVVGSVSRGR